MQTARLFEIVYILLRQENTTARQLAARFEVSTRTIYRDVDALSAAGIPVYASKGKGGGIRLMEGFSLPRAMLNEEEQKEILSALQSLQAVTRADTDHVLNKLSALFSSGTDDWIRVDFSDWGFSDTRFETLKGAILSHHVVAFDYYDSYGKKTARTVEPHSLWFKHRAWYLTGYDRGKHAPRLFRLSRIQGLCATGHVFEKRALQEADGSMPSYSPSIITLTLHVAKEAAYRVYDEFDPRGITVHEDGSFTATASYPEDDWVYGFILSFGPQAKVLSPPRLQRAIQERLKKTLAHYL